MALDLTNDERRLFQRVADWPGPKRLSELDDEQLCRLSRSQGIDFATALLYQAIRASAEHGPFVRRIEQLRDDDRQPGFDDALDATLAIAPGAFYREHPETGADGKSLCAIAASRGCRTHIIPVHSVGTAAANGRILCDWLLSASEEKIILCSLSKGGADVKMALAEPDAPAAFRRVVAWLNVGGIPAGSPMANWVLQRRWLTWMYRSLFWCRGQDFSAIYELQRGGSSPLDFGVNAPASMKIIHVMGFPLAGHIRRRRTRRWHRRLSCHGPNDGAIILADNCRLPGFVFPVWGADHYLESHRRHEDLFRALLRYLGEELNLLASPTRSAHLLESAATT